MLGCRGGEHMRAMSLRWRLVVAALSPVVMLAGTLVTPTSVQAQEPAIAGDFIPGEIIVTYDHDATSGERRQVRARAAAEAPRGERIGPQVELVRVDPSMSVTAAIAAIESMEGVAHAEPNYVIESAAASNDPAYLAGDLWGLYGPTSTPSSAAGSNVARAWDVGHTGTDKVHVAIIDSGFDITHPDLTTNTWANPAEVKGVIGVDDDGNGFVDDVHGWDFVRDDASVFDSGEYPHGTHVAGIIGAAGGNGIGVSGVAWDVTMIPVKMINDTGTGNVADAIAAIDYVTMLRTRLGIDIVASNNSWTLGSVYSSALEDAIRRGGDAGIAFVTSAGNDAIDNDALPVWPANMDCATSSRPWDCITTVAAVTPSGQLAPFSNYGRDNVDLAAPGIDIVSTLPGGGYGSMSGTSMAAPFVTGAMALCSSAYRGLSAYELKELLMSSATPLPALADRVASDGTLDAGALLPRCAAAQQSFADAPARVTASAYYTNRVRLDWEDATSGEYEHEIQVAQGPAGCSGTFAHHAYIGPGLSSYTIRGLEEAQFYCFRIRSLRDEVTSPWIVSNLAITWTSNSPFISGRVLMHDQSTGVARARVHWRARGAAGTHDLSVYTDASGFYALQVPSGTAGTLWVQTPYQSPYTGNAWKFVYPSPVLPLGMRVGGNLTVTADRTVDLRMPPVRMVDHRIVDAVTGAPIAGGRVSGDARNVFCMSNTSAGYSAFTGAELPSGADPALLGCMFDPFGHYADQRPATDAGGRISFAVIDERLSGRGYTMTVAHPATSSRLLQHPFTADRDHSGDLSMPGSQTLSGRVLLADRTTTVRDAQVKWRAKGFDSSADVATRSASDGTYSIEVPRGVEGTLWVDVPSQSPYASSTRPVTHPAPQLPLGMRVGGNLTVDAPSTVDVIMPALRTITFRFTDAHTGQPVAHAQVSGDRRNVYCVANASAGYTAFSGARTPNGMDPALLGCMFDPFGHYADYRARANAQGEVTLAFVDDTTFGRNYTITATDPQDPVRVVQHTFRALDDTMITLPVDGYRTLSGRVTLADGVTTVRDARVKWRAQGATSAGDLSVYSDAGGRYSLSVPSGVEGTLWVETLSKAPTSRGQSPAYVYPTPMLPLGLRVGGNLRLTEDRSVELRMPPIKRVTFKVIDAYTDAPVEGAAIDGDGRNVFCLANAPAGYTAFPGARIPSGMEPALLGCMFDPFGHYADAPALTNAQGEITLAFIDDTTYGRDYTFTATHPLDDARVGARTIRAIDDTVVQVVMPGTPGIPKQPTATPSTSQVELTWEEPWDGKAFIDYYQVWMALDPSGPYERVTTGTCAGDIPAQRRSCVVDGLTPGTRYYFAILAHNQVGYSEPARVSALTKVPQTVTWQPGTTTVPLPVTGTLPTPLAQRTPSDGSTITYSLAGGSATCSVDAGTGALTATTPGTCTVIATAVESATHAEASASITFTIMVAPEPTPTPTPTPTPEPTPSPTPTPEPSPTPTPEPTPSPTPTPEPSPTPIPAPAPAPAPAPGPAPGPDPSPTPTPTPTPDPGPETPPVYEGPSLQQSPQAILAPVAPGESHVVVDGRIVTLDPVVGSGRLLLNGEGFSVTLAPTNVDGSSMRLAADGVIEVPASGGLQARAEGYCASCALDVYWLRDNLEAPRSMRSSTVAYPVTSVTTSSVGNFNGAIGLPAGLPLGQGVLQIIGEGAGGSLRVLNVGMRIAAETSVVVPVPTLQINARRGGPGSAHVITIHGIATGFKTRKVMVRVRIAAGTRSRQVERIVMLRADGSFTARVQSRDVVRIVAFVDGEASNTLRIGALRT
jgi:subtilisin family serine protease